MATFASNGSQLQSLAVSGSLWKSVTVNGHSGPKQSKFQSIDDPAQDFICSLFWLTVLVFKELNITISHSGGEAHVFS